MKRFLCSILVIIVMLGFVGCKKGDKNNQSGQNNDLYNLTECMNQGKIPEAEYTLGVNPQKIIDDGKDEEVYFSEGPNSCSIVVGDYYYYYEKGAESKGISSIVCFSTAFGVEVNGYDSKSDIKNKFSSVTFEEREISSSQAYFVPHQIENWSALTCKTDTKRIDFVFQDETLVAINLVDTANWTLT